MNQIINNALIELLSYLITEQIPFTLAVDNHNDWTSELPSRLSSQKRFLLNMENTDLTDSYIDSNGDIIITAGIDGEVYTKIFTHCDIHSIGELNKPPLIVKQFTTQSEYIPSKTSTVTSEEGIAHSTATFRKHNPEMFRKV